MPGRRIVLCAAATAVVAVAAGVAWLLTADLGIFKSELEARITRASGREFEIRGGFSVRLGRHAVLVADGIYWRNARWADERYMLQIGRVEAEVDLLSAIRGPLIVERVLIRDARVSVDRNADYESNWAVFDPDTKAAPRQSDDMSPRFLLRHARLSNIAMRFTQPTLREPLDLQIRSMRQDVVEDDVIRASVAATFNEREISASGNVGTWSSMVRHDPVHVEIAARLGSTRIRSSGVIDSLADPRHPRLRFSVRGPSSGDLFALAGLGERGIGDVDLHGSLHPAGDGSLRLGIQGSLGQCRIAAKGSLPDLRGFDQLEIEARISGPNLRRVLVRLERLQRLLPVPDGLSGPFSVEADLELLSNAVRAKEGTVVRFGEHTARIDGLIGTGAGLRGSDLDIGLSGRSIADLGRIVYSIDRLPAAPYEVRAEVRIDDAGYWLRGVRSRIGGSALRMEGLVTRRRGLAGSHGAVSIEGAALEDLLPELRHRVRRGPFRLSADVAVLVDTIRFRRVRFAHEYASISGELEAARPWSVDSGSFSVEGRGPDARALLGEAGPFEPAALPWSLAVEGDRRGTAWSFTQLGLKLGDARAGISGALEYGNKLRSIRLTVDGAIPSLGRLGSIEGRRLPRRSVAVHTTLAGDGQGLTAKDLRLDVDEGSLDGEIAWKRGDVPFIAVRLRSDRLVLRPHGSNRRTGAVSERASEAGRVIPDLRIPFDALGSLDASVQLDVSRMVRDTLRLRDVVLSAEMRDGGLVVSELRFRGDSGTFQGKAVLKPAGGAGYARADVTTDGLRLDVDVDDRFEGMTVHSFAHLASSGADLRALASNADGVMLVEARNGRLANSGVLQAVYGDLVREIVSKVNPFVETREYTHLECVIAPMEINDGRMQSAPATLILTGEAQMAVQNDIDLGTEEIDLRFQTTPRKTLGISAGEVMNPYIRIAGTLAEPRLAIDREGAAVAGGTAIATGGLSVLAKAAWDRLSKSGDPCGAAAAEARETLRD